MLIALTILLTLAVLIALAYPIVQQARGRTAGPVVTTAEESLAELMADRDAAFQAIRDLKFDHDVGKITDDDLATYEAHLKLNAAESLRRLDAWEAETDRAVGLNIERLVATRRQALGRGDSRPCATCGRTVAAGDPFCTGCGSAVDAAPKARVAPVGPTCPNCGRTVLTDDLFCPKCGHSLAGHMAGMKAS